MHHYKGESVKAQETKQKAFEAYASLLQAEEPDTKR